MNAQILMVLTLALFTISPHTYACDKACEKREDAALNAEIQAVAKENPSIRFDLPDADGFTLEFKVLDYAMVHGIPSYRGAFDELMGHRKYTDSHESAGRSLIECIKKEGRRCELLENARK